MRPALLLCEPARPTVRNLQSAVSQGGAMSARAMWKADLTLGEQKVPVKLYAAVRDAKVHFRLLHAADRVPVRQQMVDPATEQPVGKEEIKKAVAVDRGVYVLLTEAEQAALAPKP